MERKEFRRRLASRPHNVRFDELERLLNLYGWDLDRVQGSHHAFRRGREKVVVPFRRPAVLAVYVRIILRLTEGDDDD